VDPHGKQRVVKASARFLRFGILRLVASVYVETTIISYLNREAD